MTKPSTSILRFELLNLRTQNHYAALQIQRLFRGYKCRRFLWSYNGIFRVHFLIKIQRLYRGHVGRKIAFHKARDRIYFYASKIQNINKLFVAKRELRLLRAERTLKNVILLQRKFRDRRERRLWAIILLKMKDEKARRIQRVFRSYIGRRRFKSIKLRKIQKYKDITQAIKNDVVLSANYTLKVGINMIDLTRYDNEWDLLYFILLEFIGTNRQIAYLNSIIFLVRSYPDFFYGKFFLCVILFSVWTSIGSQRLIVEDLLAEALDLLEFLKSNVATTRKIYNEKRKLLPEEFTGIDKFSSFSIYFEDMMEVVLEEIEHMFFHNGFRRHGYTDVTYSQMAFFLIVRSEITLSSDMKTKCLKRAKELFKKARNKAHSKAAEEMFLRIELFNQMYEEEQNLILRRKRPFKDCILSDVVNNQYSGIRKGGRDDRLKLNVEIDFFQMGEMLTVQGKIISSVSNRAMTTSSSTQCKKWSESIKIRPLILLARDLKPLFEISVKFVSKLFKQSEHEVARRGKWGVLTEYLFHELRIVSYESKYSTSNPNKSNNSELTFNSRDSLFSAAKFVLPQVEYRHRERNSQVLEEHGLKLMQRTYRGFRGRALWRRLCKRKLSRMAQNKTTINKLKQLTDIRNFRFEMSAKIQARIRGYLWRKRLRYLNQCAINCQRVYRGYSGRVFAIKERKRRLYGADVAEMIRRGEVISGKKVTLVMYRCGQNYRILVQDLINKLEYHGNIWANEVNSFLDAHNQQFIGTDVNTNQLRIKPWQHNKVADLLSTNLSITERIRSVSNNIGPNHLRSPYAVVFMKSAHGPGVCK